MNLYIFVKTHDGYVYMTVELHILLILLLLFMLCR